MSKIMNQDKMKALAAELAKDLKTPEDLSVFSAQLTKISVEAALNAEMDSHLGYSRHNGIANIRVSNGLGNCFL